MIKSVSGQYNVYEYMLKRKNISFSAKGLSEALGVSENSINTSLRKLYKFRMIKKSEKDNKGVRGHSVSAYYVD